MNAPDRFDSYTLPPGTKKVQIMGQINGMKNSMLFKLEREDHTLGNMIRCQLQKNPKVIFAGYKMPHPLKNYIELYIQTTHDYTPAMAFNDALANLIHIIGTLRTKFEMGVVPARFEAKQNKYKDRAPPTRLVSEEVSRLTKRREEARRAKGVQVEQDKNFLDPMYKYLNEETNESDLAKNLDYQVYGESANFESNTLPDYQSGFGGQSLQFDIPSSAAFGRSFDQPPPIQSQFNVDDITQFNNQTSGGNDSYEWANKTPPNEENDNEDNYDEPDDF